METTSANNQVLVGKSYKAGYYSNIGTGNPTFWTDSNSISAGPGYNDGKLHNIVDVLLSNGRAYIYVDGIQQASGTGMYLATDTNSLEIGVSPVVGSYTNGIIADVQIYNTSLDANQVQALYMEGIGGVPVNLQHIVGWWPLNGDFNDYSGNGNVGTPTSMAFTSSWTSGYTQP